MPIFSLQFLQQPFVFKHHHNQQYPLASKSVITAREYATFLKTLSYLKQYISGPYWVIMRHSLFRVHPEGAMHRMIRMHQVDPFTIWLFAFMIRALFGGPWAKTRFGKRRKTAVFHWMKLHSAGTKRATSFSRRGPKRAFLTLFWTLGGLRPIQNRQFCRHVKTVAENGPNPIRDYWSVMWYGKRGPCQHRGQKFWRSNEKN